MISGLELFSSSASQLGGRLSPEFRWRGWEVLVVSFFPRYLKAIVGWWMRGY